MALLASLPQNLEDIFKPNNVQYCSGDLFIPHSHGQNRNLSRGNWVLGTACGCAGH